MAEHTSSDQRVCQWLGELLENCSKSYQARGLCPHKDDLQKTTSWLHGKSSPHIWFSKALVFSLLVNHSDQPQVCGRGRLYGLLAEKPSMPASWHGWAMCLLPGSPPSPSRSQAPHAKSMPGPLSWYSPAPDTVHPVAISSIHFPEHTQPNLGPVSNSLPPKLHFYTIRPNIDDLISGKQHNLWQNFNAGY